MIKSILSIASGLLLSIQINGQIYFQSADSIKVYSNSIELPNPFQGGFNAPQFNEIDLNQDGKLDLLIFDRSGSRITTYLNGGIADSIDYTLAPEYADKFPFISNWVLTRDYNCDGKMDLFTGIRSSAVEVFENTSTPSNGLNFTFAGRVSSDYGGINININPGGENLPGIGDVNNDGDIDFIFFGGIGSQMEFHKNLSKELNGTCGLIFERRSSCWGSFTEAGFNSTIYLDSCRFGNAVPNPEKTKDPIRTLPKYYSSSDKSNKHAGSTVTIVDLDNSGSSDLVLGDIGSRRLTAMYNGDSVAPFINSKITIKDSLFPSYDKSVNLDLFPSSFFIDLNNDNNKDMIVSSNSNSLLDLTKYNNNILFYENMDTSGFTLEYRTDRLFQEDVLDFGRGCYPTYFDFNNDGLMDILVGNDGYLDTALNIVVSKLALLENTGTSTIPEFTLIDTNYNNIPAIPLDLANNQAQKNLKPTMGDLDGDGDFDMILGDIAGNIHYLKDTSSSNANSAFELEEAAMQGMSVFSNAAPYLFDLDSDGLLDLLIGNGIGKIEYHKNLGDSTTPIFNLEIQSIIWQRDSILRYTLEGNPDLSSIQIGSTLDVNNARNPDNNVFQIVDFVDNNLKYIDLKHPFTSSNIDDELNSPAVIDYSIKDWGNISLSQFAFDQNAVPYMYYDSVSSPQLIISSKNGVLYRYDSILTNTTGAFHLADSSIIDHNFGENIFAHGADINGDGMVDLAIGNQAGGFSIYYGSNTPSSNDTTGNNDTTININEITLSTNLENEIFIFPNPTKGQFQIRIPKEITGPYTFTLRDLSGRIVDQKESFGNNFKYENATLSPGIYIISINDEEKFYSSKLIKQP